MSEILDLNSYQESFSKEGLYVFLNAKKRFDRVRNVLGMNAEMRLVDLACGNSVGFTEQRTVGRDYEAAFAYIAALSGNEVLGVDRYRQVSDQPVPFSNIGYDLVPVLEDPLGVEFSKMLSLARFGHDLGSIDLIHTNMFVGGEAATSPHLAKGLMARGLDEMQVEKAVAMYRENLRSIALLYLKVGGALVIDNDLRVKVRTTSGYILEKDDLF